MSQELQIPHVETIPDEWEEQRKEHQATKANNPDIRTGVFTVGQSVDLAYIRQKGFVLESIKARIVHKANELIKEKTNDGREYNVYTTPIQTFDAPDASHIKPIRYLQASIRIALINPLDAQPGEHTEHAYTEETQSDWAYLDQDLVGRAVLDDYIYYLPGIRKLPTTEQYVAIQLNPDVRKFKKLRGSERGLLVRVDGLLYSVERPVLGPPRIDSKEAWRDLLAVDIEGIPEVIAKATDIELVEFEIEG